MSRLGWILPGLLAGLTALIAGLPLSWVAPHIVPQTLPALQYDGTLWRGTVSAIPVFETANIRLQPLGLLARLEAGDGASYVRADVNRAEAKDIRLVVDLSELPLTDQRLQGLIGSVRADLAKLGYGVAGCTTVQGTVRTDVLQRNGGSVQWTGPELSGPVTCEAGALIAVLDGQDAQQTVEARLRFSPDGSYRADVTARTTREEAGAILPLFGFTRDGLDYRLTEQGQWR